MHKSNINLGIKSCYIVYNMPLETNNPFTLKNYSIAESSISSCNNLTNKSKIVTLSDIQNYISQGYNLSNKMNLLEVNKYITNEMNKFLIKINLAKTCSMYIMQDDDSSQEECKATFTNYVKNQMQFGTGNNVLDNFTYTDNYINKQKTDNDKKHMCQRLADLQSLMTDYNGILNQMNTADIKSKYLDHYSSIMEEHKKNMKMRQELEQKLDFIYSTETRYGNSKQYLDSTIYISVLWTILGTTILFYIFKKM